MSKIFPKINVKKIFPKINVKFHSSIITHNQTSE